MLISKVQFLREHRGDPSIKFLARVAPEYDRASGKGAGGREKRQNHIKLLLN